MEPISIASIALFVAQNIASYGFNKGLEKIFEDQEDFVQHMFKIINKTIEIYQKKYPTIDKGGKFAFYKSQIIIEEFLKYRIFASSGYSFDVSNIQMAIKQNPNVIMPDGDELSKFKSIFDELAKGDILLRKLEIEAFYKEEIFEIKSIVEKLKSSFDASALEVLGRLEAEYEAEIEDLNEDLEKLKAKTALRKLDNIEERIQKNSTSISSNVWANLYHLKASCLELTGQTKIAYQFHIKAYKKIPSNIKYLDRACFSYYGLKDKKYEDLILLLEDNDEYNPVLWAIRVYQSKGVIHFIENSVPSIVLDNPRFKRLVFHHYLKESKIDIINLLDVLDFKKLYQDLPENINNENFFYAISILNGISTTFFRNSRVSFWGFMEKNDESLRFLNLSRLLAKSIELGELDNNLNSVIFYSYWLESELDCGRNTLRKLEDSYQRFSSREPFQTILYVTAFFKHNRIENIISFFDNYTGDYDENLYAFKAYLELSHFNTAKTALIYLSQLKVVDSFNIQNVCSFLMIIVSNKMLPDSNIEKILNQLNYENVAYNELCAMMFESFSNEKEKVLLSEIEALKNNLNTDSSLFFYIAQVFFENGYFKECSDFIKSYIEENEETRDLALYIYSLNYQKTENQVELLRLLKKWRDNFSFNFDFLNFELELRQILKDWEEVYQIALYGYKYLPDNESVFTTLILAISYLDKSIEIEEYLPKIREIKFESTENLLRVVSVLLKFKYFDDALELLYSKALNKFDVLARQTFFFISTSVPKKFFKRYKKVERGRYVKLEINQESKIYCIDDESMKNQPILKESIGKNVNDIYTISTGLNNSRLIQVRVISVMNKYLALSDEIMEEATSPFSAMDMEPIKIETSNKESIDRALIENFAGQQQVWKKHNEENLNKYYIYNFSFSELIKANYEGSYFDGYYNLTSNVHNGFVVKPLKYYSALDGSKEYKYIIDFSSGLLLFDLTEKYDLKFDKFIISKSLLHLIDNLIRETELNKKSRLSVSIENNKVIPHLVPKNFHKNRISRLVEIKEWFLANSEVIVPEEKLGVMRQLNEEVEKNEVSMEYLVDNAFLAQRENHILVSDDLIYSRYLKVVENTCSTEIFLRKHFPKRQNELVMFMIDKRYIGLTLNAEILDECYTGQYKEGKSHLFKYALRNLSLKANYQPGNLMTVVKFLKFIALNPIVNSEKYQIDATNILVALILGMNDVLQIMYLKALIYKEFKFIGNYLDITLNCLLDAMKILNISGNSNS